MEVWQGLLIGISVPVGIIILLYILAACGLIRQTPRTPAVDVHVARSDSEKLSV